MNEINGVFVVVYDSGKQTLDDRFKNLDKPKYIPPETDNDVGVLIIDKKTKGFTGVLQTELKKHVKEWIDTLQEDGSFDDGGY